MVFATCKALQENAMHYKNEAVRLRANVRHVESQGSEELSRIRGGIEAQMMSGIMHACVRIYMHTCMHA